MLGRILLTLEGVMLLFGVLADWNETPIHSPRWPPHASNASTQTAKDSLRTAGFLGPIYWEADWASLLCPGTSGLDLEFGGPGASECVGGDTGTGVPCCGPVGTQPEGGTEREGTRALSRIGTGGCFVRLQAT
ncbi:uncharacterized protein LY79DRAFT_591247 [Colletotrichum navitas]|uniref:Uncharacterized protein n=1 Tax=Colletotrichum navitas TaxID=681940 RepID=A0AAD8PWG5_9PEZI|nr:uncharacterized protein LY79DRAFT_591247 [Colletotrichum navitas]KAK1585762.1 hypothetical protein LY79DRAFT_591247 [Colletotrichum navitas]